MFAFAVVILFLSAIFSGDVNSLKSPTDRFIGRWLIFVILFVTVFATPQWLLGPYIIGAVLVLTNRK